MSIKLLPASLNPVDPSQVSDVSTSIAPLTPRAVGTQAGQSSLVPSGDTFSWSSSARHVDATWIDGTFVEDSHSDATASAGEYVSGLAWNRPGSPMFIYFLLRFNARQYGESKHDEQ